MICVGALLHALSSLQIESCCVAPGVNLWPDNNCPWVLFIFFIPLSSGGETNQGVLRVLDQGRPHLNGGTVFQKCWLPGQGYAHSHQVRLPSWELQTSRRSDPTVVKDKKTNQRWE